MRPGQALAEDLRKVGVALLVAGAVLGFLEEQVSTGAALYAAFIGMLLGVAGYWLHDREEKTE